MTLFACETFIDVRKEKNVKVRFVADLIVNQVGKTQSRERTTFQSKLCWIAKYTIIMISIIGGRQIARTDWTSFPDDQRSRIRTARQKNWNHLRITISSKTIQRTPRERVTTLYERWFTLTAIDQQISWKMQTESNEKLRLNNGQRGKQNTANHKRTLEHLMSQEKENQRQQKTTNVSTELYSRVILLLCYLFVCDSVCALCVSSDCWRSQSRSQCKALREWKKKKKTSTNDIQHTKTTIRNAFFFVYVTVRVLETRFRRSLLLSVFRSPFSSFVAHRRLLNRLYKCCRLHSVFIGGWSFKV